MHGIVKLIDKQENVFDEKRYSSRGMRHMVIEKWHEERPETIKYLFIQIAPSANIFNVRKTDGRNIGSKNPFW